MSYSQMSEYDSDDVYAGMPASVKKRAFSRSQDYRVTTHEPVKYKNEQRGLSRSSHDKSRCAVVYAISGYITIHITARALVKGKKFSFSC